ncbi:MAG: hypothetical protein PHQ97_15180 [Desulfobacterales bacterium]|nr:hypothetical protein [Desulfobacterales bacterium]
MVYKVKKILSALFRKNTAAKKMSNLNANLEKNGVKYKETQLKKLNNTTGNTKQTPKNTGSPVRTKTNTPEMVKSSAKTGLDDIPNTAKTTNVYKKGGTLATLGFGALIGGVATALSGAANSILPDGGGNGGDDGGNGGDGGGKEGGGGNQDWYNDADDEAASILDGLSDIPGVGDIVDAAKEGGWSLPLLAGIIIVLIAAAAFAYKKFAGKKPSRSAPSRRKKTAKTAKARSSA